MSILRTCAMAGGLLLSGLAACSLTTDLDDITGGTTATGVSSDGGGGSGTGGGAAGCEFVSDCPPAQNACMTPLCLGGQCGTLAQPSGTRVPDGLQTTGDCLAVVCDGDGSEAEQNDDDDKPEQQECAILTCNSGNVVETLIDLNEQCDGGDKVCDGAGSCVECNQFSDCSDLPENGACHQRACTNGTCESLFTQEGTAVDAQSTGDCKLVVCDGSGGTTVQAKTDDLPNDGNICTVDSCDGINPVFDGSGTDGNSCPAGLCSGGKCVGCTTADDCGEPTSCMSWICATGQVCEADYVPSGEPLSAGQQTTGDCQRLECDGSGGIVTVADNADLPEDDGTECTIETCVNGSPEVQFAVINTPCPLSGGGTYCDGNGSCVDCNSPGQCEPPTGECEVAACVAHACTVGYLPQGTPSPDQVDGDCKLRVCMNGGTVAVTEQESDLPVDGLQCTEDVCTGMVPSNPPADPGVPCTEGDGHVCNGAGQCVQCVNDTHCLASQYCSGSRCLADRANGATCTRAAMCQSTYCVDGVCCNSACTGLCRACVASKTDSGDGVCALITGLTDPDDECAGDYLCQNGACCYLYEALPPSPTPQKEPIPLGPCE